MFTRPHASDASQVVDLIKEAFSYSPDTGALYRNGRIAGGRSTGGYLRVQFMSKTFSVHRIAWLLVTGAWPAGEIDHINGVRTDNRLSNLRDVSRSINAQNKGSALRSNSTSDCLGVNRHVSYGRRFRAQIWRDGKNHHIGYFDTAEAAHEAYLSAKFECHPGFVLERFV